jgi:hypothetical protein
LPQVPQFNGSVAVLTQEDPHFAKLGLQETPHVTPLHVAVPSAGTGQGMHEVPQLSVLVFETHTPLHR